MFQGLYSLMGEKDKNKSMLKICVNDKLSVHQNYFLYDMDTQLILNSLSFDDGYMHGLYIDNMRRIDCPSFTSGTKNLYMQP